MISTPKHLKGISELVECKSERLTVKIKCHCGSSDFWVLKNIPVPKGDNKLIQATKQWHDENKLIFPYSEEEKKQFNEKYYHFRIEKNAEGWYHKVYRPNDYNQGKPIEGAIPLKVWFFKKDEIPLCPSDVRLHVTDSNVIFKVKCASCAEEYLLFDNRIHGNDAADFLPEILDELEEYDFKQKQIKAADGKPTEIHVTIRNPWDFDDVSLNGNEGLTADDYSNMFGHIIIKAYIEGKKPVTIYSEELG